MSSSTYSRSESSRGHRHSSGKDPKHRKQHSSKSVGPAPGTGPRFLFVVNEMTFDPTYNVRFPLDSWGSSVPPCAPGAYGPEFAGRVFQYDSGHVTPAPEYSWHRPGLGFSGEIRRYGANGTSHTMIAYKTGSVFACSPHLPIIVAGCDVSCDPTFVFKDDCVCDAAAPGENEPSRWNILCFFHGNNHTQVSAFSEGSPYVLGGNPSWIPSLVPRVFENPGENVSRSTGLGGDLRTLIGLMAFHGRTGRASDVFNSGKWQQNQWHGSARAPAGYPNPLHEAPRGFVVHVAFDRSIESLGEDDVDYLKEQFESFESRTVFVRG